MTLWLYLHFPCLQLDTLYAESAQDSSAPALVIVEGRRNRIVQLNDAALTQGIKQGMGLATAASFCSSLQVHAYDENCETKKLKEIAHWLYMVTSDISFFVPNGMLLRVSNMLTLYDGLVNYWQILQTHLNKLAVRYDFAFAYSPYGARLLARRAFNQVTDSKQVIHKAMGVCGIAETDLPARQVDKLTRVGIHHVADLLNIPMAELAKRFDADLVNYVGRLTGQFFHSVDFYHPPEQFHRSIDLLFEVSDLKHLEKPLRKLLVQLESFLRIRDQFAHALSLRLVLRNEENVMVQTTSAAGEYLSEKWLALLQLRFESVVLRSPVISLSLMAERVAAKPGDMSDLFDGKCGNTSPLELVSLLQAKLGEQAVQGIRVTEDPRPHLSTQFCAPLSGSRGSVSSSAVSSSPSSLSSQSSKNAALNTEKIRPSILLPQPQPLREKVSIVLGPERIATGWWDDQPMIRDYFVARSANGSWVWIFRTPEQRWFLHGVFS